MKSLILTMALSLMVAAARGQAPSPLRIATETDADIISLPTACGTDIREGGLDILVACVDLDKLNVYFPGAGRGKQTQILIRSSSRDVAAVKVELVSVDGETINRDERWAALSTDMVGNWNALLAIDGRGDPRRFVIRLYSNWRPPRGGALVGQTH